MERREVDVYLWPHLVIHDNLVRRGVQVSGFLEEVLFDGLVLLLVGFLDIVCRQCVKGPHLE